MNDSASGRWRSPVIAFAAGSAVSSLGTGIFTATATIYFVTLVGFSTALIGVVISGGAFAGLLAASAVGRTADRLGVRSVLVAMLLVRGAAYGSLALTTSVPVYVVLMILAVAGDQVTPPLQQALVGELVPDDRRTTALATLRSVRNVALTAGFGIGGAILAMDSAAMFRMALAANGVSFAILAAVVARPASDRDVRLATVTPARAGAARVVAAARNRPFLALAALNAVLLLHDSVLVVLLPLWVATRTDLPHAMVSVFLTVNTALTVVLQLTLSRRRLGRRWQSALPLAGGSLVLMCMLFAVAAATRGVAAMALAGAAIVALAWGENVHALAAWTLSYDLAPVERTAEYLSVFNTSASLKSILGPVLMTTVVLPAGLVGWPLLAGLFVASTALMPSLARRCAAVSRRGVRTDSAMT
jgi:MFS family permease